MIMEFGGKKQEQTAGDNSTQIQNIVEHQENYNVTHVNVYNTSGAKTDVMSENNQEETLTIQMEDTSLWKRTLGKSHQNVIPLKESYLQARERVVSQLEKIKHEFPKLSVPSITQIESLWNVADTIIGKNYNINPLEGYILGMAFLMHDTALSNFAISDKVILRNTPEWKDVYFEITDKEDKQVFMDECDAAAIRILHKRNCKQLQLESDEIKNSLSIVDDASDEYLKRYRDLICRIAASRFWDIDDVEKKLSGQDNPMPKMPIEWTINTLKLACILRCAIAGHFDDGYVPENLYQSLDTNGVNREYWEKNICLSQVCKDSKDKTKLCFSSEPFKRIDFAAWNVAYDAVRLFDEEIKKSNHLLIANDIKEFPCNGVSGTSSKEDFSKYVKTLGWQPYDFGVHTSNVKSLIENLGGSKLYGEDNLLLVALRELIQNARDAIQARRIMDDCPEEGQVTIRLKEEEGKRWIEVEDDGIGMSLDCIKNHLLDFGSSYWKSNLVRFDYPGLRSKRFKSIGKFGIGFYSVFMVAKSVVVITRRYEENDNANKIEFPEGLTLSPILSVDKMSTRVSTLVRFELKDDVRINFSVKYHSLAISLQKALSLIVAGLDVDVFYEENGNKASVHQNITSSTFDKRDWLSQLFVNNLPKDFDTIANRLEFLKDDDENVMGLLAIADEGYLSFFYHNDYFKVLTPSIETVCGLATSFNSIWVQKGFVGFIDGRENNVSRNDIILDGKTARCLKKWIKERYDAEYNKIIDPEESLSRCYYSAFTYCGMDLNEIVEGNIRTLYLTFKQRGVEIGTIKGLKRIHVLLFAGASTFAGQYRDHDEYFYLNENNKKTSAVSTDALGSVLRYVEKMPEDSYEQIICKYFKMLIVHPFTDGNGRVGRIWANLMLDRFMGKMIDWRNVEKSILNEMVFSKSSAIERSLEMFKEERFEDACCYLEQFLVPSNTYIAIMTAQRDENK